MILVLSLTTAMGASPVLTSGLQPGAETALLRCARTAKAAGKLSRMRHCLRAWATLGPAQVPDDLRAEAASAQAWSRDAGRLQVFGTIRGPRLQVGVRDPAGVVDRIEAWSAGPSGAVPLKQLDAGHPDRIWFGPLGGNEIRIRALSTSLGEVVVLREIVMGAESWVPPSAPEPVSVVEAPALSDDSRLPWWFWVGAVLAAAIAGVAVVREARF